VRHLMVVLCVTSLVACGGNRRDGADTDTARAGAHAPPGFLKFAPVAESSAPDVGNLSATIEFDEQHTARLNAPVAGRVSELLVQVGDVVAADQPLITLDSPEVKAAYAEHVRAEADLTTARRTADRAGRLRAANAIADKDYLQAQEDVQKAAADFERARAQLERLRIDLGDRSSHYEVRAPFAGTVVERRALVGTEVGADSADPLVVVSDLSRVRVVVRLPERHLALARPGRAVRVHVDAYPQDFPGEVTAVGDVVDDATQTVPVRCTVSNPDRLLKPSMFARVTLKAPADVHLVTVPLDAVLSDGQRFQVVVRKPDGELELRGVDVGAEVDGSVQVLSGVAVGEEIVTEGALFAARSLARS